MKINLNTILLILGGLGVFAPDVAWVASALTSLHVGWLAYPVRFVGLLAAFCAAAPLVVPRLRAFLALLGLATPPGALAPWVPGKPGDPQLTAPVDVPVLVRAARLPDPGSVSVPVSDKEAETPVLTRLVPRPPSKG